MGLTETECKESEAEEAAIFLYQKWEEMLRGIQSIMIAGVKRLNARSENMKQT